MENISLKPMGYKESLILFVVPALLLYIATHWCIPGLHKWSGLPVVVCWFICGGTLVFLPLFIFSFIFYRREGHPWSFRTIRKRFRLDRFSPLTLAITLAGIISIALLTFLFIKVGEKIFSGFSAQPSFMTMQPLRPGEFWILAAWLPMFFFNIMGEGFFWRGYIFPRQQLKFGRRTWLIHGLYWTLFHLSFGGFLLYTLLPIIFITSYIVQFTRNTWTDIIIHTVINGTGFLLVAFGAVR